ncbi:MAG: winged helix-turn-helix domain-containing protein [Bilifractor sp.]|jgi:DNA-binding response OmpR family regulator
MARKDRILIVEDDADISMIEETYLQSAGYDTDVLTDGADILVYLDEHPCDLVLLDLMLPGKNGYEICEEIRKKYDLPILMVTARNESVDKVRGFNSGADDYIPKPFDPMELTARVRANLRQYRRLKESGSDSGTQQGAVPEIRIGDLRIQPDSWRVFKKDQEVRLANREFELLKFMAQNPNIVFSREQLMERIWGYDYVGDTSTVMVHINRLREKIEDDPKNPKILETVWGAGYRLNRKPG